MNISEICLPNRLAYLKHHAEFRAIFGKSLKTFWDGNLLGFNIIEFDHFINPTESESTYEAITRQYGKRAVVVVKGLLQQPNF